MRFPGTVPVFHVTIAAVADTTTRSYLTLQSMNCDGAYLPIPCFFIPSLDIEESLDIESFDIESFDMPCWAMSSLLMFSIFPFFMPSLPILSLDVVSCWAGGPVD